MKRRCSVAGYVVIKAFESFRARAYRCPAGKWTIGWGSTRGVHPGMTCSGAQAYEWLRKDVAEIEAALNDLITVPVTQAMFDALCSFTYNVGIGNLRKSTLLRLLNSGDYAGAAEQFLRWTYAGGRQLPGLVKRRKREAEMFLAVDLERAA